VEEEEIFGEQYYEIDKSTLIRMVQQAKTNLDGEWARGYF